MVDIGELIPKINRKTRLELLRGEIKMITCDVNGFQEVFFLSTQQEIDQILDIFDILSEQKGQPIMEIIRKNVSVLQLQGKIDAYAALFGKQANRVLVQIQGTFEDQEGHLIILSDRWYRLDTSLMWGRRFLPIVVEEGEEVRRLAPFEDTIAQVCFS